MVRVTVQDTQVIWKIRRLAEEYDLSPQKVARILKALGAVRFSGGKSGTKWIWELEEKEERVREHSL